MYFNPPRESFSKQIGTQLGFESQSFRLKSLISLMEMIEERRK